MTQAEEVLEALLGRVATCICGRAVGSTEISCDVVCACNRRWRKQMPPSESWCTYQQIDRNGHRRHTILSTTSCGKHHYQRDGRGR